MAHVSIQGFFPPCIALQEEKEALAYVCVRVCVLVRMVDSFLALEEVTKDKII